MKILIDGIDMTNDVAHWEGFTTITERPAKDLSHTVLSPLVVEYRFTFKGGEVAFYASNRVEMVESDSTANIETPEEKEALDNLPSISHEHLNSSESPNGSNDIVKPLWSNGDECVYLNSRECVFIGMRMNSKTHCIIETKSSGTYMPVNIEEISKPETPQQREEREREEFKVEICKDLGIEAVGCNTACIINKLYELGYKKESHE